MNFHIIIPLLAIVSISAEDIKVKEFQTYSRDGSLANYGVVFQSNSKIEFIAVYYHDSENMKKYVVDFKNGLISDSVILNKITDLPIESIEPVSVESTREIIKRLNAFGIDNKIISMVK